MNRQNAFFEGMKRTGHAWEESRKARLEKRRELEKTCGYDSEEYSTWLAANPEKPFPFSHGASKAYQAWAGIETFIYTGHSTALMENIHQLAAEGCTMTGLYKAEHEERWGTTTVMGIRFSVN